MTETQKQHSSSGSTEMGVKSHTAAGSSVDPSVPTAETDPRAAPSPPGDRPALSSQQRCLLACLGAGTLLTGCCMLVQVPFFPHEAHRRGLTSVESSTVFSAFSLSEVTMFPVMGWLAPRLGVTRLYQLGLAGAGLVTVIFGLLGYVKDSRSFLAAGVAARVAEAIGTTAAQTAARTLVASQFSDRLNTVLGFVEAMSGAGLCLGPALGGALYGLGGYGVPFYLLGGLHLALSAASLLVVPKLQQPETDASSPEQRNERAGEKHRSGCCRWSQTGYVRMVVLILTTPDNWLGFAVLMIASFNWAAVDINLEVYVNSALHMGPAELGVFFLGSFVGYAVASPLWGRVSDALDNTFLLVAGLLAPTTLGVLLISPSPLLGLAPSRLLLGLGMVLRETFLSGAYLVMLGLLLRRSVARGLPSDVHGQATVAAVYGTVFSAGRVAGPLVGSLLTERLGFPGMATALGAATAAGSLAMALRGLVYRRHRKPNKEKPFGKNYGAF